MTKSDETKTTNTNPENGAGEKTFTQEDVNGIVSRRLAEEKAKGQAALAEKEHQLAQRELMLTAKEKLTDAGLPVELMDALNVSSTEAMEKAITTLKGVIDKIKAENPRAVQISGATAANGTVTTPNGVDAQLRKAMGLS